MNPAEIAAFIADRTSARIGVSAADLRSRKIASGVAHARQLAVYLTHRNTEESTPVIAALFGLDQTTVRYTVKRVPQMAADSPRISGDIAALQAEIEAAFPDLRRRSESAVARFHRLQVAGTPTARVAASAELDALMTELRRGLAVAIRIDPGRVLAGFKRAIDDVNRRPRP